MSKILILGGAGFIGSNLIRPLLDNGHQIRVFTRAGKSIGSISHMLDSIDLVYGDFLDEYAVKRALEGMGYVYHLISTTFPGTTLHSSIYDIQSNLIPTVRLLECCADAGIRKLIYASSGGTVYGEPKEMPITENHPMAPTSIYGNSKKMIENYLSFFAQYSKIKIDVLRLSNPYGPKQNLYGAQGLVAVAIGHLLDGRSLKIIGDGSAVRDYIYIDDVISAMVKCLDKPQSLLLNISSGVGQSIIDIINAIETVSGDTLKREHVSVRPGDVSVNVLCNQRARKVLEWEPKTDLLEGTRHIWEWAKSGRWQ